MFNWIRKHALVLYCLLVSVVVLGICSKNSPLYPMNDWVDVHCFFTMGRSILQGKVLYRDLYEQKGPVLYFLYALISLFSGRSFWGVFLMEIAAFTLFLYYSARIIRLYNDSLLFASLSVTVLAVIVGTSPALAHGGSAEELCLGMMTYGLYTLLSCARMQQPLSTRQALLNGIFAGMILWIKFTMLGFYLGLCLSVLAYYLLCGKGFRRLLAAIGSFLGGVGLITAVVLLYFIFAGALKDLFTAYFYNNLFLYPSQSDSSKLEQLHFCLKWALHYNGGFRILIWLGGLWLLAMCRREPMALLCTAACFAGLIGLTYWGGKGIMQGYGYYDLVLAIFPVFGLCAIGWVLQLLPKKLQLPLLRPVIPMLLAAFLALAGALSLRFGRNTYLMSYEKEDMPQYQFAQIIQQTPSPTLLNYGFLDGGFYYAANVVPNCRFFCTFNIAAPDMWETQWEALWAGEFDYVVTRQYPLPTTFGKYALVSTAEMPFEGIDFTYYLYQRKELGS